MGFFCLFGLAIFFPPNEALSSLGQLCGMWQPFFSRPCGLLALKVKGSFCHCFFFFFCMFVCFFFNGNQHLLSFLY